MNHSSTLEFSSQPPVSVYGTGCFSRFSWNLIRYIITSTVASVYYRLRFNGDYSVSTQQLPGRSVTFNESRYGNINPLSIHYPVRVRVRSRLTRQLISMADGILGLSVCGFLARIIVTYPYICFSNPLHHTSQFTASAQTECSPTTSITTVHSFGNMLMPDYCPCLIARLVSCYALFK